MAHLNLTITPEQAGRSVLSVLKNELKLSSTCINRLKRTEFGLTVNDQRVFTNVLLSVGDVLSVDLSATEQPTKVAPIAIPLDIVYEDEHLLILNKQAPLAVIPSSLAPEDFAASKKSVADGNSHANVGAPKKVCFDADVHTGSRLVQNKDGRVAN